jgi:hypothetical protein
MKIAVFWAAEPCSLVETHRSFRGPLIALMMTADGISERLVNIYQTTRNCNPEDRNLHTLRC